MTVDEHGALIGRLRDAAPAGSERGYRAPGRANLIGEHTDYNGGFVLPVALDIATYVVGRASDRVALESLDEPGRVEIDIDHPDTSGDGWGRYVAAVVKALRDDGAPMHGFEGVVGSEVPVGSGLSSSAALEVALVWALSEEELDATRIAHICKHAENVYVGVQTGIMDQLASAAGRAGHALLIDCENEGVEAVRVPEEVRVVVIDSGVRRGLSGSVYNERRSQCEQAAAALGVPSLRHATEADLERLGGAVNEVVYRRARHVVTENGRVLEAARALKNRDLVSLGSLFSASHASLSADYEVSIPELDDLVLLAGETPGVVGARLTGAGFGGCTVNLVRSGDVEDAAASIARRYEEEVGKKARFWVSRPADGAGEMTL